MNLSGNVDYLFIDGQRAVEYERFDGEPPNANEVRLLMPLAEALPVILEKFSGWMVAPVTDTLADALVAAGAVQLRHSAMMRRTLVAGHQPPESTFDYRIEPVVGHQEAMAELSVRAYPASHPDHEATDPAVALPDIQGLVDGSMIGPLLESSSGVALGPTGVVIAACLINRMPYDNLTGGGPWVSEIFRDPSDRHRGLGQDLLQWSMRALSLAGEETLGLAVTVGNPARGLYERLGFEVLAERRKLQLP
ncbi:MAG: GNAT family N-acetyltransferase [Acidimicrobiales bacterium]